MLPGLALNKKLFTNECKSLTFYCQECSTAFTIFGVVDVTLKSFLFLTTKVKCLFVSMQIFVASAFILLIGDCLNYANSVAAKFFAVCFEMKMTKLS
jgi:hypothetical protein